MKSILRVGKPKPKPQPAPAPAPAASPLKLVKIGDFELPTPTTFGVDAAGRVYVGSGSGAVNRLDPA